MNKLLTVLLIAGLANSAISQVYTTPGTYNTCSGTFYDTGGQFGNYGPNQANVWTFCNPTPGEQITIDFSFVDVENGFDELYVLDGDFASGNWSISDVLSGFYTNISFTSSTIGCLSFVFFSDNIVQLSGWSGTISCTVFGCTNPAASNFDPLANYDDGSCVFPGVDYVHPTQGGAGEFVGACLVNDCGPFTYTDNGGPSGNYSDDIGNPGFGGIYRVFCPDQAGNCMEVTFNSFNTNDPGGTANDDYLTIGNGPTQNSPFFTTPPALANGRIQGSPAVPFTYTSTDASGCLTFRFFSNATITRPGWNATLQCVPCAGGPNGTDNNDCSNITGICGTYTLGGNATGPGLSSDGCEFGQCPAGGENYTNWFAFEVSSSGTLELEIIPSVGTDDYDFTLYGPNPSCSNLGDPIRCSDAAVTGITGTDAAAGDPIEPAAGDGFVTPLNVNAGDIYYLVIDEWTPTGAGYTLNFTGSAGLDCSVLPVELSEFTAEYAPDMDIVDLFWVTDSERDNDRFEVEKSTDGVNWEIINVVKGQGTTQNQTQYYVVDENPHIGINYYRLNQWDIDGNGKYSEVRSVNILDNFYDMISTFPNPTNGLTEVIFNSYTKGTVDLKVTDYSGKVVVNAPIDVVSGGNRFDLDLTEQERGIYLISITTRDKVYHTRVVKE